MFLRAIKLVLKEETKFDLYFNDGTVKRYDVSILFNKYPQIKPLSNRKLFLKGKLFGWGGIVWTDEIDLPTEFIHDEGEDVSDQYNDIGQVVFGESVNYKRLSLGLTQEELAAKVGVERSTVSKWVKRFPAIRAWSSNCRPTRITATGLCSVEPRTSPAVCSSSRERSASIITPPSEAASRST